MIDSHSRDPLGGVPREHKMLKGQRPRVIYHQVYKYTKINLLSDLLNPRADHALGCRSLHTTLIALPNSALYRVFVLNPPLPPNPNPQTPTDPNPEPYTLHPDC